MELDRVRSDARLSMLEIEERDPNNARLRAEPQLRTCLAHLPAPISAPGGGGTSTSQGHPRTVRRALERGNLMLAELTAREAGPADARRDARASGADRPQGSAPASGSHR